MKKTIDVSLSVSSLQNAIKELKAYQARLDHRCAIIAERLADDGVEVARVQLANLDAIFKGELIESIQSECVTDTEGSHIWAVVAGTDHAAFVEFGTGVIGQKKPYKGELPPGVSWQYASGQTIHQLKDGRIGWFYKDDNGHWWFTEGMPSRPYMYNTARELERKVKNVVKEVFDNG